LFFNQVSHPETTLSFASPNPIDKVNADNAMTQSAKESTKIKSLLAMKDSRLRLMLTFTLRTLTDYGSRGLNEYTTGSSFENMTEKDVDDVMEKLNSGNA
jgi:hypothetical protein